MTRYALDCEMDGRAFNGTQVQARGRTLQGLLGDALTGIAGVRTIPRPASRLDAGVSAEHLPCDATVPLDWPPSQLVAALNAQMPADLVVLRAAKVADEWHAQRQAVAKRYRYQVALRATRPALEPRSVWVRQIDHPELLHPMALMLVGRQDLSGFACLRHDGSDEDDPIRRIVAASWEIQPADTGVRMTFRITGAGFLYKQIRGMVGAMLTVAQGRRTIGHFERMVADGRAAQKVGNVAPAHGLVLEAVHYQPEPDWQGP